MCENCGINHDTNELEDQGALNGFLSRLIDGVGLDDSSTDDLFNMIASLFDEPEPMEDLFAKHSLTSEYDLFGSNELVNDWKVSVVKVPADTPEDSELHGFDWVLQGYHEGNLVASTAGTPPEPVTAREAAQVFAEYHFGYVID